MVKSDGSIHVDELVTYVNAPGYRSIALVIRMNMGTHKENVILQFSKRDALAIMHAIRDVNVLAWASGRPGDAETGEKQPEWIP
jgi:hypothetical protein